jgi:hypothetical protein
MYQDKAMACTKHAPPGTAPLRAAAPVLAVCALAIGAALIIAGTVKATVDRAQQHIQVAGAEQMRRQAEAARAFRSGQYASAYGRYAELADEGDAQSAAMALILVHQGLSMFGSEWSASLGQLLRWSALAQADMRERAAVIAEHDRGE